MPEETSTVKGVQRSAPASTNLGASGRATVTAAGTAEQLTSTSTKCIWVTVTAELNNTGVICIGGSSVVAALATRTGTPLEAGDSAYVPIADLSYLYIDATVTGDGVTYDYGV